MFPLSRLKHMGIHGGAAPFTPDENELVGTTSPSSPADGATVAHASFAPTWTAARRATSYDLQTATNSGFSSGVVTTNTQALTLNPGLGAGSFYWRVRARNRRGVSAWTTGRAVTLS